MISRLVAASLTLLVPLSVGSGTGHAQALYDSFSTPSIDAVKWKGIEENNNFGVLKNTELLRRVVLGALQLQLTTFGSTESSSGISGTGSNILRINHPALVDNVPAIRVIQATLKIKAAVAEPCAADGGETSTTVQIVGHFFNSGANVTPGDLTDDVLAGVTVEANSTFGNHIQGFIRRCTNSDCSTLEDVGAVQFIRTWELDAADTLILRWKRASSEFSFTANGSLGNETRTLSYTLSDTAAPKALIIKDLRVQNMPANCTAGSVQASIDARFDGVRLDATAVEATMP